MRDDDVRAALQRHRAGSDAGDFKTEHAIHDGHVHRAIARDALPVDTIALARFLLGQVVVRETPAGTLSGRIVETEAYPVGDAAGHAYRGQTPRNRALFLEHGHAYVYVSYGLHAMLNVSSEADGVGAGVLIRALEPLEGIAAMQRHRHPLASVGAERVDLRALTRGPGRLAASLDIDRRFDGVDLCRAGPLWLAHGDAAAPDIGTSTRIGITREADRPLRFYVRGNRFVSGTKTLNR